jgi:hypothetical protein
VLGLGLGKHLFSYATGPGQYFGDSHRVTVRIRRVRVRVGVKTKDRV